MVYKNTMPFILSIDVYALNINTNMHKTEISRIKTYLDELQ